HRDPRIRRTQRRHHQLNARDGPAVHRGRGAAAQRADVAGPAQRHRRAGVAAMIMGVVGASVGFGLAAAVLLLVLGLRRRPRWSRRPGALGTGGLGAVWMQWTRRPPGAAGRRRDLWWLGSGVLAVLAFALSGLPVTLVAVPLVTILVPWLLSNPNAAGIVRTAAIDQWVRSLRSLLLSGSDNTLEGALQSSLATAPEAIREPVQLLVARINARWPTERALAMLAAELADPTADVVAAALVLAAKRRGTG